MKKRPLDAAITQQLPAGLAAPTARPTPQIRRWTEVFGPASSRLRALFGLASRARGCLARARRAD